MFLNFLENIFASWEANFISATMFPEVGKQGNIERKHNVFAKMFPSLPRAKNLCVSTKMHVLRTEYPLAAIFLAEKMADFVIRVCQNKCDYLNQIHQII